MESEVRFLSSSLFDGLEKICSGIEIKYMDMVCIKMDLDSCINPRYIGKIVEIIDNKGGMPFILDTIDLCVQNNGIDLLENARKNGYCYEVLGCPIIPGDGILGEDEVEVSNGSKIHLSEPALNASSILSIIDLEDEEKMITGGAIFSIGMGLASRRGKLDMYKFGKPEIDDECTGCLKCMSICPRNAIVITSSSSSSSTSNRVQIDEKRCIGCARCIGFCDAIHLPEIKEMQSIVSEYALAISAQKPIYHMIFLRGIGILASRDPVAIEQCSHDMAHIEDHAFNDMLEYAQRMGLGSRRYKIKEIF